MTDEVKSPEEFSEVPVTKSFEPKVKPTVQQLTVKMLPTRPFDGKYPVFQPDNLGAGIRMMAVKFTLKAQPVWKSDWDKAEEAPDAVWNEVHISGLRR